MAAIEANDTNESKRTSGRARQEYTDARRFGWPRQGAQDRRQVLPEPAINANIRLYKRQITELRAEAARTHGENMSELVRDILDRHLVRPRPGGYWT
jgi:hypothetical protein